MKIVKAEIEEAPRDFPTALDILFQRGGDLQDKVNVEYEDGSTEELFGFYYDELSFKPSDFIGLTRQEGLDLFYDRDIAYLRS